MPLLWPSLAFLSGLLFSSLVTWTWAAWLSLAGVCMLLCIAIRRFIPPGSPLAWLRGLAYGASPLMLPPLVLLAVLLGGAARFQASQEALLNGPETIARYNDTGSVRITGMVVDLPNQRDTATYLTVQVSQVSPSSSDGPVNSPRPTRGLILVQASPLIQYQYGDVLQMDGNPGGPANELTYQSKGILSTLSFAKITRLSRGQGNPILAALYAFKKHALSVVEQIFSPPESDLMAGILLGVASGIPADLQQAFKNTGTAHIIAISGYNISILAGLFYLLFTRLLGRQKGALAAAVAIAFYTLLVGAGASVLRAAIMAWIGLLGEQIGRRQAGANSLAFTGAVMCLVTPTLPWDISFQLTFMATLGLVLYATPMQAVFRQVVSRWLPAPWTARLIGPVSDYVLVTLAAQVTSLPVMAYQFRSLSLVSLIANPLVLPPQPMVEILGGMTLLGGLIDLAVGRWLAYLAWPFAAYTNRMVMALAAIPNSAISLGQVSLLLVILFYAVLFWITLSKDKTRLLRTILSPLPALVGLSAITVVVWSQALTRPDGNLHLILLEAGATESLLIQSPDGQRILINGGSGSSQLNQALGRRQSLLDRKLDLLVITSAQKGDLVGLPHAIENFPPQRVLWAVLPGTSAATRLFSDALPTLPGLASTAQAGQSLDLGQGASLKILSLGDKQGATFLLQWGLFRALLPVSWLSTHKASSAPPGAEDWQEPVNVLLLSADSAAWLNPSDWIAALHPQAVLLSIPAQNRLQAPSPESLQALRGYTVLRTNQNGWVEVTTDGKQMWVNVEKK